MAVPPFGNFPFFHAFPILLPIPLIGVVEVEKATPPAVGIFVSNHVETGGCTLVAFVCFSSRFATENRRIGFGQVAILVESDGTAALIYQDEGSFFADPWNDRFTIDSMRNSKRGGEEICP